eukprot:scaffold957_cov180-Chaetoceros_neogracile.AAC.4
MDHVEELAAALGNGTERMMKACSLVGNLPLFLDCGEKHAVTTTELVEEGIKEGQKENEVAPPLEENNEVHEDGPAVSV